ncbi:unnamed protein product [Adineta ricciae]|uniref:Uncharacterized protein n=1 Tax=Adineta ricciae TaxID=249248 RepID=A0A814MJ03_ADIRI|nr:unnamed protein product [Adineta ricciae]CAF1081573.1 unnamed protein product [Adineta ricciae]
MNFVKKKIILSIFYLRKIFSKLFGIYLRYRRFTLCAILLITILFVFNGQTLHKGQFYLGLFISANVRSVQPLQCASDNYQPEWPHSVNVQNKSDYNLTVVIVTARPEFKRLPATVAALLCHLDSRRIAEVMFLVPPKDVSLLEPYLSKEQAKQWPWPVSLISDDTLLKHQYTMSYRLQMMFKLFIAQIVQTEYYLILDSDCLALWPIHAEQLLYKNETSSIFRAAFQVEGNTGHAKWWSESEELLQIKLESCVKANTSSIPAMGVTPSILSRTIALRTLCRLQKLYGETFLTIMAKWYYWRLLFGRMWTEYTLYFLTARCTNIFDLYHFHHSSLPSSSTVPVLNLYGLSIWGLSDWTTKNQNHLVEAINKGLKWRRKEMEEYNGQGIIDKTTNIHSLFTVLQGRHQVDPKLYHELFYPLYIEYLQKQKQTEKLLHILNNMVKTLIVE